MDDSQFPAIRGLQRTLTPRFQFAIVLGAMATAAIAVGMLFIDRAATAE